MPLHRPSDRPTRSSTRRSLARHLLCAAGVLLPALLSSSAVHAASADDWTPAAAGLVGYDAPPVWTDEFDSVGLDRTKWTPQDTAWPHNGELQYYSPDPKYVDTQDGFLKITATDDPNGGRNYTSGRIDTRHHVQFRHGLFAARIKMTHGQGLWAAWWMFGTGPKYSEIDMAELVGGDSALNPKPNSDSCCGNDGSYGTLIHFSIDDLPTAKVTKGPGASFKAPPGKKFADDYHVMWFEWTGTEMWGGLDTDQRRKIIDDVSNLEAFNAHMYLILNVAIGGGFPGSPDETTQFPNTMSVDWVRVWAKNGEDIMRVIGTEPVDPQPEPSGPAAPIDPLPSGPTPPVDPVEPEPEPEPVPSGPATPVDPQPSSTGAAQIPDPSDPIVDPTPSVPDSGNSDVPTPSDPNNDIPLDSAAPALNGAGAITILSIAIGWIAMML